MKRMHVLPISKIILICFVLLYAHTIQAGIPGKSKLIPLAAHQDTTKLKDIIKGATTVNDDDLTSSDHNQDRQLNVADLMMMVTENASNTLTIKLPGNVTMDLVKISTGTYRMGRNPAEKDSDVDEDPQHSVTIANEFYIGKYEVTKKQWKAIMNTSPWSVKDLIIEHPDSPAIWISWDQVQQFVTALNAHITQTNQGPANFRLPSEAEWEHACRAGTTTRFYWGEDPDYLQIGEYTWNRVNAWDANEKFAHVVGRKKPNPWGLCDISGNVYEWCQDKYYPDYNGAPTDGSAREDGAATKRSMRGGSWGHDQKGCRSADREGFETDYTCLDLGFRLAISK